MRLKTKTKQTALMKSKRRKKNPWLDQNVFKTHPYERETVLKLPLKKVVRNSEFVSTIQNAVIRTHQLTVDAYHLLNLHILHLLNSEMSSIPLMNANYIIKYFQMVASKDKETKLRGGKCHEDAGVKNIYDTFYIPNLDNCKVFTSKYRLTQVCKYSAQEIQTAIENNLKGHFLKRQRKVLRLINPDLTNGEIFNLQKSILMGIFNDEKYDSFIPIELTGFNGTPEEKMKFLLRMLDENPQAFLLPTFRMLQHCEQHFSANEMEMKYFSILPLRRSFIPQNIHLDSQALFQLFREFFDWKDNSFKKDVNLQYTNHQYEMWNTIFKIDKYCKHNRNGAKKKVFNYFVTTNGISISLHQMVECERKPKDKENREPFRTMSNLSQSQREILSQPDNSIVGVDPGKHQLITCVDKTGNIKLRYTRAQRRRETRTRFNHRLRKKLLNGNEKIKELQSTLSNFHSRTSDMKKFIDYMKQRSKMEVEVGNFYSQMIFRKMKWDRFIHTQKSESRLVNAIKEKFGKDVVLAYGSWSNPFQMRGMEPTPGIGLKRRLSRDFQVITVNEAFTSSVCFSCGSRAFAIPKLEHEHWNPKKKLEGIRLPVRGLRRCTNENCRKLWNRDHLGALNILKNFHHWIHNNEQHPLFSNVTWNAKKKSTNMKKRKEYMNQKESKEEKKKKKKKNPSIFNSKKKDTLQN